MSLDIRDVLAEQPELTWVVARVKTINLTTKKLTLVIGNIGESFAQVIGGASYVSSYVPKQGEIVHALMHPKVGVLVIGSSTAGSPKEVYIGNVAPTDLNILLWVRP